MAAVFGLAINDGVRFFDDKRFIRTVLPEEVSGKKLILKFKEGALQVFSEKGRVLAHAQEGSITERDVVLATACPDNVGTRRRLLDLTPDGLAKLRS